MHDKSLGGVDVGYIEGITISTCINIVCVCGLVILTGYTGLFPWDTPVSCVWEHMLQQS